MSKQSFIQFIEENIDVQDMPRDVLEYWNEFKTEKVKNTGFTANGKMILTFMKNNYETASSFSAKMLADALMVSTRTISGSIRKLVNDGYVRKISGNPVEYQITENGLNVNII